MVVPSVLNEILNDVTTTAATNDHQHDISACVRSELDNIIESVVIQAESGLFSNEEDIDSDGSSCAHSSGPEESEYLRMIKRNVAECRAAFALAFADEIEEVRLMKEAAREKRKRKKPVKKAVAVSTRKSSRLRAKLSDDMSTVEMSGLVPSRSVEQTGIGETSGTFPDGMDVTINDNLDDDEGSCVPVGDDQGQSAPEDVSSVSSCPEVLDAAGRAGDIEYEHSDHSTEATSSDLGKYGCLPCAHSFRYCHYIGSSLIFVWQFL